MENRKPFELKNLILVYNAFQVMFSLWLVYEFLVSGWWNEYSFKCQPIDQRNSGNPLRMAKVSWWYFISKFTEFTDTFFFVLRKKFNHISVLHIIHHGLMPMSGKCKDLRNKFKLRLSFLVWWGLKFLPGGHSTFFGMANASVHAIMYFYYFLAALGPEYQKYLWWKKHLTTLQMAQFIIIMYHAFQLLFIDCEYPNALAYFIGCHAIGFFILFAFYFKQTYGVKKKQK